MKRNATHKESLLVQHEGGRPVQRKASIYNLDVIIAVGYRVNSKKATRFRIWATQILREYLTNGYALNERKLVNESEKLEDVYDTLEFIESPKLKGKLKGKVTVRITRDLI